jgi:hypothetical protein
MKRQGNLESRPVGTVHVNLLLDTREFEVELAKGSSIPQHLCSKIDKERNQHVLLNNITYHRQRESAVAICDALVIM